MAFWFGTTKSSSEKNQIIARAQGVSTASSK